MKNLLYIAVAVIGLNVFCNASTPSETIHHYAQNAKEDLKNTLRKPVTSTEQTIGIVMVVGGVCGILFSHTLTGAILTTAGALLATGKMQDFITFAKKKINDVMYSINKDTRTQSSH